MRVQVGITVECWMAVSSLSVYEAVASWKPLLHKHASKFLARKGDSSLFRYVTMDLQSTQLLIQWVFGALDKEIKWPRYKADHSPASTSEVKNEWRSCISHPPYTIMACKGATKHFLSPRNPH